MREQLPTQLIALLARLELATPAQVGRMAGRVGRLARDLPRFESVWVDALAQARVLTPFQAAEINAGRGESLRVGPYVLCGRLRWPDYTTCYKARHVKSRQWVRLAVMCESGDRADTIHTRLEALAAASVGRPSGAVQATQSSNDISALSPLGNDESRRIAGPEVGRDAGRVWAAWPWIEGRTAAEWMVHNGRFPPEAVLEIARAMSADLVELERSGVCHGDISAWGIVLTEAGRAVMLQPGLRGIVRPEEGYAHHDLLPEAYDYLPPERITDGTPPTVAGDVYAAGCVWWHLLCGRPPLSGGDSLAKLRSAQAAEIVDPRRWAPEAPGPLATAIAACLRREPSRRPESMTRLAAMLGSPTVCGKQCLSRCLTQSGRPGVRWPVSVRTNRVSSQRTLWLTATACCCLLIGAAILFPAWRTGATASSDAASEPSAGRLAEPAALSSNVVSPEASPLPPAAAVTRQDTTPGDQRPSAGGDPSVVPAGFVEAGPASTASSIARPELVLASGRPLRVESLRLEPGQRVCGQSGQRPLLLVSGAGLGVAAENVCFENIDFVYEATAGPGDPAAARAMIDLRASCAEFRGCTFQSTQSATAPPTAVCWTYPPETGKPAMSLPSGRVKFDRCVLRGVDAVVDCRTNAALAVEATDTLVLGGGPLARLDHCPAAAEPLRIALLRVTCRGGGPLLECRYRSVADSPGEIAIDAAGCVFAPRVNTALLSFSGPQPPEAILPNISWTGQGSLVSPETTIAAWRSPDGSQRSLDDAAISMDGLVWSEVAFAGDQQSTPAASQIVRWQAPLRSADPPGVDPRILPVDAEPHR